MKTARSFLLLFTAFSLGVSSVALGKELKLEGKELKSCKVTGVHTQRGSVQWIEGTKTLTVFVEPEVDRVTISGFPIKKEESIEVIRRDKEKAGKEPIIVRSDKREQLAGTIKGDNVISVGVPRAPGVIIPGAVEIKANGQLVGVNNQAIEVKANGDVKNVFALAINNKGVIRANGGVIQLGGAGGRVFLNRVVPNIPEPEAVTMNGKGFGTSKPLGAKFFDEWTVKIGGEAFVLAVREDGAVQEFDKGGRKYRFLVTGHPDQLQVISEQDSPKLFESELRERGIAFDPVNQPHALGRATIGNRAIIRWAN